MHSQINFQRAFLGKILKADFKFYLEMQRTKNNQNNPEKEQLEDLLNPTLRLTIKLSK